MWYWMLFLKFHSVALVPLTAVQPLLRQFGSFQLTTIHSMDLTEEETEDIYTVFGALRLSTEFEQLTSMNVISLGNHNLVESLQMLIFKEPTVNYIAVNGEPIDDEVLRHIWVKYHILNFFIIQNDPNCARTYNPAWDEVVVLNLTNDTELLHYFKTRFKDWKRSVIRVVGFSRKLSFYVVNSTYATGYVAEVISAACGCLNATWEFAESSDGVRYGQKNPDGYLIGPFRDILNGDADVTANGHFMQNYDVAELKFSHYLTEEGLCLVVPKAEAIPHFIAIFRSFNDVLCAVAGAYAVAISVFLFLRKFDRLGTTQHNLSSAGAYALIYMILLGAPFSIKFRSSAERFIFGSLLLMSVIISNLFQSVLVTMMNAPEREKNLETIDEVARSGVEIWLSSSSVLNSLKSDERIGRINWKLITKENKPQRDDSAIGWTIRVNVLRPKRVIVYRGSGMNETQHIVKECLGTYAIGLVLPTSSPLGAELNHIIERTIESGLIGKWVLDGDVEGISPKEIPNKKTKPLALEEIFMALVLLLVGTGVALIVFLAEVTFYYGRFSIR